MPSAPEPVVVLIFAHEPQMKWFQKISLTQCFRILGKHPIRLVCPEGLDLAEYRALVPGLQVDFIPGHWLASLRAYNQLKIMPWLYRRYAGFENILTCELDAFVFRDELPSWCRQGWDYIGAPWFEGYHRATPDATPRGVGNSGFSLRRTSAMLRVLDSWRSLEPAREVLQEWRQGRRSFKQAVSAVLFRKKHFPPVEKYSGQEDFFWGQFVPRRFPLFRLAPHEIAARFSFEVNPGRLFRECGGNLPFGCHKWMRFEPQFWNEHLQPFGYELPPEFTTAAVGRI